MTPALPTRRAALLGTVAAALLLGACASGPRLTSSWRDPQFTGPPKSKPLVLGVSRSDTNRRVFEDGFVQGLRAAGSGGVASHTVAAESGSELTRERLQSALDRSGADSLLTTRVVNVDRRINVVPGPPTMMMAPSPWGMGFHPWYGSAWAMSPPDVVQYDVITIETTLWDAKSDRVIWAATSETTQTGNVARIAEGMVANLVPKMKADGVLR